MRVPMKVADLFTGLGGFTMALDVFEGMETTVYCDIDARSHIVLNHAMDNGDLPRAPIHPDVRTLHLAPGDVDMIVGGFPCTGFSTVGFREGINNQGSGLVHQVFRLVSEARPTFVFMENVPTITKFDEYTDICNTFATLGYDMSWICLRANDFGAPHRRLRWFALCTKRDATPPHSIRLKEPHTKVPLYDWTGDQPPRMLEQREPYYKERVFLLGNTVVPTVARAAFIALFTGLTQDFQALLHATEWTFQRPVMEDVQTKKETFCGMWHDGRHVPLRPPSMNLGLKRPLGLVIDPTLFVSPKERQEKKNQTFAPLLEQERAIPFWATPRCRMGSSNYLTRRTSTDLITQIRFERQTEHRYGYVCSEFLEWMQGYPVGYTKVAAKRYVQETQ